MLAIEKTSRVARVQADQLLLGDEIIIFQWLVDFSMRTLTIGPLWESAPLS
ncbi:MAG: hypothetical protein GXC75_00745 [Xanthomonadaceae bacterium]|nr:hypothetical protein [Xanthomonadaceae bacterium]